MLQKKTLLQWVTLLLCMVLLLSACGNDNNATENNSSNVNTQTEDTASSNEQAAEEDAAEDADQATAYPLTVTDITGQEVVIEQQPEAIVSLVPSETEIAFAVGAGDIVVGVDEFSNYPEETANIAKVGDMSTNIEAVVALNPDLVLANDGMNTEAIGKLRELGITVYSSNPVTYDETVAHIEQVGVLLNKQAEAQAVADHMKQVKADIQAKVADADKRNVYLEFSPGWTVGNATFLDDLVTIAGGINIAAEQPGWYEIDGEAIIAKNPDVIIFPDFGEEQSSILAGIMSRPGWDVVDAVKNDRLVMVNNDPLVRVGPRLVDGLQDIAAAIHPELFN
ncbi:ABC transporter substrate-binding protein [Paenibacillus camelliae]|uniref:ABC transporter substrate-binding protein n=1 Tax=Paenibacillus camelliae TaxID=512410 RepID=UPI00203FCB36|nr:ABC transporter substrate-binding protein [Paenibacillus camelliae]MCM3631930.1 ABC transporter substrate-binding protein [Paenibacillus camelliae]